MDFIELTEERVLALKKITPTAEEVTTVVIFINFIYFGAPSMIRFVGIL